MMLHAHTDAQYASAWEGLLHEVLLDALIDSLKLLPFLFLTYLLMEFIEHKASSKTLSILKKSGKAGPAVGALIGAVPQCAFSAVASNLYTGRVITLGTLISVFLSTSDEMLPIMISNGAPVSTVLAILGYKISVALISGFTIDLVLHISKKKKPDINIDEICDNDNCHCERGIFFSAMHHTITISIFILLATLAVNALVFFIGANTLGEWMSRIPFLSHLIAALVGLIPGCATSVALTTLGLEGIITEGVMMSGLLSGAGVGILILTRLNKHWRENIAIMGLLTCIGFVFGILFDFLGLSLAA